MQYRWFALIAPVFLLLAACQPQEIILEVTRLVEVEKEQVVEVTRIVQEVVVAEAAIEQATPVLGEGEIVEVTRSPLGSAARPVQLLFPPSFDTSVINQRAAPLAETLSAETGYQFVIGILDDEQTVIETVCAAPVETIGFLSAGGYVLARELCGVEPAAVAVHGNGLPWETGMLVTRRGGDITGLEDLAGKRWAVGDSGSLPNFLYFQALLADAGLQAGEIVEFSGDSAAMLALYEDEVDFATAEFIPPIMPYEERLWDYEEDDPEPHRYLGIPPTRSPIGYVLVNGEPEFGGYRLRDARSRIFDVAPEIYNRTGILTLSGQIPNETVVFGPDFPLHLSRQVETILYDFASSAGCLESLCSTDFYGWSGLQPVNDDAYTPIRFVRETLALPDEQLLRLAH